MRNEADKNTEKQTYGRQDTGDDSSHDDIARTVTSSRNAINSGLTTMKRVAVFEGSEGDKPRTAMSR